MIHSTLAIREFCRNKYRLAFVCAVLFLATGCANQSSNLSPASSSSKSVTTSTANVPDKTANSPKEGLEGMSETSNYILEAVIGDIGNWPKRIVEDSRESCLRPDNLAILLMAGGASVVLHNSGVDDKVADNFRDHHSFHGFTDEGLNVAGHPWTHLGFAALWYANSKKNQDNFNLERAKAMIAALSVTNVVTFGLKAIRHNDTPNGKDWAWPSGHASSSFTVASMLDEFYGPNVGIPAYLLASLISYRMLDTGDHWTSDVVFGAALGWVVGHTFADRQKQLEIAGFKVLPYTNYVPATNDTVMGVNLVKRF